MPPVLRAGWPSARSADPQNCQVLRGNALAGPSRHACHIGVRFILVLSEEKPWWGGVFRVVDMSHCSIWVCDVIASTNRNLWRSFLLLVLEDEALVMR